MMLCKQSQNETVWEHCQSVSRTYADLISHGATSERLPKIIRDNLDLILSNQIDRKIVKDYLEWHDCGKPFCATVMPDGRTSFPNHAAISKKLFIEAGGNAESANLVGLDMIFHIAKCNEIMALGLSAQTLYTLMLSAWAAIFANAGMFGGVESESFKIKVSQLTARCKKIL